MRTMIRIATLAAVLVFATACGSADSGSGSTAPPPATANTGGKTTRLAFGSYCWSAPGVTGCGDTGDPSRIPGLPVIHATRGATIVIRLGFDPTERVDVSIGHRHVQLDPARVLRIRADRPGLLDIGADHGPDDASYLARIRLDRP